MFYDKNSSVTLGSSVQDHQTAGQSRTVKTVPFVMSLNLSERPTSVSVYMINVCSANEGVYNELAGREYFH